MLNPEGVRFLADDLLLKQLAECFTELEHAPFKPTAAFSIDRIENSLTHGFFDLVGTMTKSQEGCSLLEKHRLYTSFYRLCELGQRDDVVRLLLECFDYNL